jgi:hypothetical protein
MLIVHKDEASFPGQVSVKWLNAARPTHRDMARGMCDANLVGC